MEIITIRQMLRTMEGGDPFSITFITYDRRRRKGGAVRTFPEAELLQRKKKEVEGRPMTRREKAGLPADFSEKSPRHRKWYTRNIRILQDGHPTALVKKIHPPLVVFFNGKNVVP